MTRNLTAQIAADLYDAGVGIFDPMPLGWAAVKAAERIGAKAVKAEVKAINRKRDRLALIPVTFPYGHPLF